MARFTLPRTELVRMENYFNRLSTPQNVICDNQVQIKAIQDKLTFTFSNDTFKMRYKDFVVVANEPAHEEVSIILPLAKFAQITNHTDYRLSETEPISISLNNEELIIHKRNKDEVIKGLNVSLDNPLLNEEQFKAEDKSVLFIGELISGTSKATKLAKADSKFNSIYFGTTNGSIDVFGGDATQRVKSEIPLLKPNQHKQQFRVNKTDWNKLNIVLKPYEKEMAEIEFAENGTKFALAMADGSLFVVNSTLPDQADLSEVELVTTANSILASAVDNQMTITLPIGVSILKSLVSATPVLTLNNDVIKDITAQNNRAFMGGFRADEEREYLPKNVTIAYQAKDVLAFLNSLPEGSGFPLVIDKNGALILNFDPENPKLSEHATFIVAGTVTNKIM